ncbi:MAG: ATP-binding protein [Deltaproteobacteria bacterium]|nr:ATP-binding protein [Deltaproteobacteria bacterium]MBT4263538.1 ATP-binding protein [Deltaproteobacteria bacterium]MBT4639153.1 ATP-binding protein [Deltaproteobacteria bacterium]MBT6501801.1 ATP-binding protein [Deltaproteobacteria bacterium]MBT7151931.1 ATP-binding protein [Deltaproteobacteria bacterium]
MWIEREITRELKNTAETFPVLVLVGPRQIGKTSLLERIFPNHKYISLDVGSNAEAAETRPQEFLDLNPPPLILDEIQYAPSFFRFIKTYVDANKGKNGLFILTGSQNFMLMESVSDSLAGRAAVIPYLGLSGLEWSKANAINHQHTWREFLWKGGFPALWADPGLLPSRDRWYQGYVSTYLERDVRNLLNVGNLRDFERYLRACAARCGQSLNLSEIGRDVGLSTTTSKQWLSVLQASNQVFLLEPFYRSLGKRIVKSPKLYFTDTGLVAYLMGFGSVESLWRSQQIGAIWENYVVSQWLRYRDWFDPSLGLWYWRDQGGNEVDLILEKDQKMIPIECKVSERPDRKSIRGIKKLKQFYGEEVIDRSFIACPIETSFDIENSTTAVSGWTTWKL